ncbi:MAG: hypothetical protein EXX96DRAFT_584790 [Benjaminiella poitrasii]|nr:MAG: hypothetical protein EXX96DRAFT_584790 [Benjaminiella poitrasii]
MVKKIFCNLKGYIIPNRLKQQEIGHYSNLFMKNGGIICNTQSNVTYIFAASSCRSRIYKNAENRLVPVLKVEWIKDCDESQKLLATTDYVLLEAKHLNLKPIPDSSMSGPSFAIILNRRFKNLPAEELVFYDDKPSPTQQENVRAEDTSVDPSFNNTKYVCLRPTTNKPKHNRKLISFLMVLERKRKLDSQYDKALEYQRSISVLKSYTREICSPKEAVQIEGIGRQSSKKIAEYLKTGVIQEAQQLLTDEEFRTLGLFTKAFGVGSIVAHSWWNKGYRTLQEVLDNESTLSKTIRLGIQLLPDFEQPMSRKDIEEIMNAIRYEADFIDKQALIVPVGSYRRGEELNNNLDLIISINNSHHALNNFFSKLIQRLRRLKYIKHILWHSASEKQSKKGKRPINPTFNDIQMCDGFEKYLCAFLQPSTGICRQVKLITVNRSELYMAVLSWTGSSSFERSVREYASKEKNMFVNSKTIVLKENGRTMNYTVQSEEEAFNIIGIPYIQPELRNC